jgi:hypothetical protein
VKTLFMWEVTNYFDVDSRGVALASFFGQRPASARKVSI